MGKMQLEVIYIHNFKSFGEYVTIGPLSGHFTAIIGANGLGKSNILDAIAFALRLGSGLRNERDASNLIHRGVSHLRSPPPSTVTSAAELAACAPCLQGADAWVLLSFVSENGRLDVARTITRTGTGATTQSYISLDDSPLSPLTGPTLAKTLAPFALDSASLASSALAQTDSAAAVRRSPQAHLRALDAAAGTAELAARAGVLEKELQQKAGAIDTLKTTVTEHGAAVQRHQTTLSDAHEQVMRWMTALERVAGGAEDVAARAESVHGRVLRQHAAKVKEAGAQAELAEQAMQTVMQVSAVAAGAAQEAEHATNLSSKAKSQLTTTDSRISDLIRQRTSLESEVDNSSLAMARAHTRATTAAAAAQQAEEAEGRLREEAETATAAAAAAATAAATSLGMMFTGSLDELLAQQAAVAAAVADKARLERELEEAEKQVQLLETQKTSTASALSEATVAVESASVAHSECTSRHNTASQEVADLERTLADLERQRPRAQPRTVQALQRRGVWAMPFSAAYTMRDNTPTLARAACAAPPLAAAIRSGVIVQSSEHAKLAVQMAGECGEMVSAYILDELVNARHPPPPPPPPPGQPKPVLTLVAPLQLTDAPSGIQHALAVLLSRVCGAWRIAQSDAAAAAHAPCVSTSGGIFGQGGSVSAARLGGVDVLGGVSETEVNSIRERCQAAKDGLRKAYSEMQAAAEKLQAARRSLAQAKQAHDACAPAQRAAQARITSIQRELATAAAVADEAALFADVDLGGLVKEAAAAAAAATAASSRAASASAALVRARGAVTAATATETRLEAEISRMKAGLEAVCNELMVAEQLYNEQLAAYQEADQRAQELTAHAREVQAELEAAKEAAKAQQAAADAAAAAARDATSAMTAASSNYTFANQLVAELQSHLATARELASQVDAVLDMGDLVADEDGLYVEPPVTVEGVSDMLSALREPPVSAQKLGSLVSVFQEACLAHETSATELKTLETELSSMSSEYTQICNERYERVSLSALDFNAAFNSIYERLTLSAAGHRGAARLALPASPDLLKDGAQLLIRPADSRWRPISELSGGQAALASVAIVLAARESGQTRSLFMFDEVDAALDSMAARAVAEELARPGMGHVLVVGLRPGIVSVASSVIGVYALGNATTASVFPPHN